MLACASCSLRNIDLVFSDKGERHLLWLALAVALLAGSYIQLNGFFGGFGLAQQYTSGLAPAIWESLTVIGDERMLLVLVLPFAWRYPKLLWAIVLAASLGGLLGRAIKEFTSLPRPPALLAASDITIIGHKLMGKSFPSGHALSVFSFVGVWLTLLRPRYWLPLLLLAVAVALSRVAVGAHWPSDILVGACLGLLAAWAGLKISHAWDWGCRPWPSRLLLVLVFGGACTLPFDSQGYAGSLALRLLFTCGALSLFLWQGYQRFIQQKARRVLP